MRTIRRTAAFKRDYRRERKGRFARTVDRELAGVVAELAEGRALAPRHRDHALGGQWMDHRDCHVRPDLVLIYRKPDAEHLDLVRLGSHSELGL
ncbi:MAG: type II toxin-antitoxin system YafQ family toxin [Rhodospirillaceae bacterium]|nr:type II toxin-antitoxin system YafQ family toxin [Rhodospirillaceae bacterium]